MGEGLTKAQQEILQLLSFSGAWAFGGEWLEEAATLVDQGFIAPYSQSQPNIFTITPAGRTALSASSSTEEDGA